MPDLLQSLQGHDYGFLRIVAELWGVRLDAPDVRSGLPWLAARLLEGDLVDEMFGLLPERAQAALAELMQNDGSMPWAGFTRRYGVVREMGPGRRDRERPYASEDASPTEALFYRALIGRAFFDTSSGVEEFAYIPDDLLELLPGQMVNDASPLGRPASPLERAHILPVSDIILDDACVLLAALRVGLPLEECTGLMQCGALTPYPLTHELLHALLMAAGVLDNHGLLLPEPARAFLEAPRGEALALLAHGWLRSPMFNDLRLMPGVSAEGAWQNDALRARQAILDSLSTIPGGQAVDVTGSGRPFWSLTAFVNAVHQAEPDFQREAGDYDSWHLRDTTSGEFLRGFEHWDDVEGRLLRFVICGPLHWLGIVELANAGEQPALPVTAFRFSPWSVDLLDGMSPSGMAQELENLVVVSDGRLRASRGTPRTARYQVARFSMWEGIKDGVYLYRLTPASLERARGQGLKLEHLLAVLKRSAQALPPTLVRALLRWESQGIEARLEQVVVLRLRSAEMMQELRSSRAGRFLGDPLGPAAIIVKPGAVEKVMAVLVELGYLGEFVEA